MALTFDQLLLTLTDVDTRVALLRRKIETYKDDWAALPAGVKNALKTRTAQEVNEIIALIAQIESEITGK